MRPVCVATPTQAQYFPWRRGGARRGAAGCVRPHLRSTPPSSEALRHSGGERRRCTSATVTLYFEVELRSERRPGTEQKTSLGFTTPPKRLSLLMGMADTALLLDLDRDTGPVETDQEAACGRRGSHPSPARPRPDRRPGLRHKPHFSSIPENSMALYPSSSLFPALFRPGDPASATRGASPHLTLPNPASQACSSSWTLSTAKVLCRDGGEIVTLSALSI